MSDYIRRFLSRMPATRRFEALVSAIDRLIELEEIRFQIEDDDTDEELYWTANGEPIGSKP